MSPAGGTSLGTLRHPAPDTHCLSRSSPPDLDDVVQSTVFSLVTNRWLCLSTHRRAFNGTTGHGPHRADAAPTTANNMKREASGSAAHAADIGDRRSGDQENNPFTQRPSSNMFGGCCCNSASPKGPARPSDAVYQQLKME